MSRTNPELARLLGELATLTELDEGSPQAFRVRAYQNAARAVEHLPRPAADMTVAELAGVKGIGTSIAKRIREYVETGTIGRLEELRAKHPAGKRELLRVPGLGAKTITLLETQLGISDLAGLVAALDDGRIADLPGMGERSADKMRTAIDRLDLTSKVTRVPITIAMPTAEAIVAAMRAIPGVEDVAYAGSLRRFRDDIGDVDVLVATRAAAPVVEAFVGLDVVRDVVAQGPTKTSVLTHDGLQVDLRVVPPEAFGAALVYFTGSKAHNIRLRQRALERELTLNEYALAPVDGGDPVASRTEEDVYAALELEWIWPELREDDGEIEQAAAGDLPTLPTVEDLLGDLHVHSDWSGDGRDSLESMIAAAVSRGYAYVALTDHAEDLRINGLSRAAMKQQRRELRELNERYPDVELLHGAELNIGPDGGIDYDPEFLATFDFGVASVHSLFSRPADQQTRRLISAIRNPAVNVIGHLSGRMLGKRPGIEFDVEAVLDAAAETGTAIEINANLRRLDATAPVIREGVRRGVTFVISTDSHATGELDYARHGVRQARRGGCPTDRIANTWDRRRFLEWVRSVRQGS